MIRQIVVNVFAENTTNTTSGNLYIGGAFPSNTVTKGTAVNICLCKTTSPSNCNSSRGFETQWTGAAALTVDKLKNLLGWGATMTGYSNDEIKSFVIFGNKMIVDDVWDGLQVLYNGRPLKGDAARVWDGEQLLREQNVINDSYWKLSNNSRNILENSLKKNYFISKFIPGPVFNGSIMSITDRWKYGMGMMGYRNLSPISSKYKHQ